jgi:hypothetical protein
MAIAEQPSIDCCGSQSRWSAAASQPAFGAKRRSWNRNAHDLSAPRSSQTLDEINEHLKSTGWYKNFPPEGVEVLSWYVMMGIGQVVTLKFPSEKLRDINALIEREAWGGYRTEFYPTYDYRALYKQEQSKNR